MSDSLEPSPSRASFGVRPWMVILGGTGLLGLALVVVWAVWGALAGARLDRVVDALRKDGHALNLAELALPPLPPDRDAAPLYLEAFALEPKGALDGSDEDEAGSLDPGKQAPLRELIAGAEAYFAKLREAARRDGCRFPRDHAAGFEAVLPDLTPMIAASKWLALRSRLAAQDGRFDEAVEDARALFRLSEAYRGEAQLVMHLVRLAILQRAVETVHRLAGPERRREDLGMLASLLPGPGSLDGEFARALKGELACGAQLILDPAGPGGVYRVMDSNPPSALQTGPWYRASCATYLEDMRRLLEAAEKPYATARSELDALGNEVPARIQILNLLSPILLPSAGRSLDRFVAARASVELLRAGLAAEIERLETGRYPARIDAVDPFTGRPFDYRPEEGTLSSAGVPGRAAGELEKDRLVWRLRRFGEPGRK
jgi:hypothetical protein